MVRMKNNCRENRREYEEKIREKKSNGEKLYLTYFPKRR